MRIFVVGTGRCGTVTFSKACEYMTNYTTGHESHAGRVGDFDYPDNHIEVDSRLVEVITILKQRYPDALFVHLIRTNREACLRSMAARKNQDVYARLHFDAKSDGDKDRRRAAEIRYAEYNARIPLLAPGCRTMHLESIKGEWCTFWHHIRAKGHMAKSIKEWDTRHNASFEA